jgi:nucleoside-diphosphate-sugar epimerase
MRVLIIGCGYVGLPLGGALVRAGHEVLGVRRGVAGAEELRAQGITPVIADITRREDMEKIPGPFDWVVNTVSSTKGGVEEYRAVYLEARDRTSNGSQPAHRKSISTPVAPVSMDRRTARG